VLLLEAGGDDDLPHVQTAKLRPTNLGSERDWGFEAEALPDPAVNGRVLPLSMGKVLGGRSSIMHLAFAIVLASKPFGRLTFLRVTESKPR
jgi:choline dehydrogenase